VGASIVCGWTFDRFYVCLEVLIEFSGAYVCGGVMEKPVIVYDGECRFCIWSVARVQKKDKQDQFDYLPRQTPGIEDHFPKLVSSDFDTGMRLMVSADDIYVGADAVYQIYRRLPPFHLVAWLYRVPLLHLFFRAGYALIARYRHLSGRVECDSDACTLSFGERVVEKEKDHQTA
jgi:predicted DCC family thiol-disulfide oxidoreductase YuxK